MRIFSVICMCFLLAFTACEGEGTKSTGINTIPAKFETPFNNSTIRKGSPAQIEVVINAIEDIDKIKVFTKDTLIFEGAPTKEALQFTVSTNTWGVGSKQISMEIMLKDGKTRKDSRIVKVMPNTFPTEFLAEAIKVYPHATTSYTQGLEFDGDQLYEGTGGRGSLGQGMVGKVNLETGEVKEKTLLEEKYFGEGITILGDKLYQLTWQEHTCFVYDKNSLEEQKTFTYSGEGWGLCNNGEHLIMTDGTERIYFRDPETFSIRKSLEVYTNEGPVKGLNELEYINGKIYANVYTTNQIVIIDPETGIVTGRIDASLIALDYREGGEVLNGIAYKESTKQLFITGKNWPNLIEIGLVEQ